MPKDILDILDTAVKIGLGALISGVATYLVTHKNQQYEKNKGRTSKKVETLEYAIENVEPYFNALGGYISRIDGALRLGFEPGKKTNDEMASHNIYKHDRLLMEQRGCLSAATSRLHLIGAQEIIDAINECADIENDFRQMVIFDKVIPNKDQLNRFRSRIKEAKAKVYASFQRQFELTQS